MLSSFKLVPFLSLLACALASGEPQQLPVNANIVQHATSSASCFELGVPTNAPIAHATNMYAMPAATEIKGSSPVNYVEGVQRNEIHAPVVNTVPVAAPVQQSPQVLHDGEETTWMFFPRPQGVNMTPEQEKEWMNECQKTACQKMEAAQSTNKVGGQSRFVPVPPTAKEQAELQKEVKSLFGNNANSQVASHQGANGVAPGKGRPDGKNLCCCCCPCCCCCCPCCCCCCKCCCCKCCCCCCPCCCC